MSEEELAPAISSQLAEVAMKYWSEESKNPVVVTKILDELKSLQIVVVYVYLYQMKLWLKIGKLCHLIKELIRDYQIFKKD